MTFFGNIASIEKTLAPKQKAVKTLTVQTGSLKLTWNVTVCNKCPRRPLKLTIDPWLCPWTWPWSRNIRYCKWVSFFIKPHLFFWSLMKFTQAVSYQFGYSLRWFKSNAETCVLTFNPGQWPDLERYNLNPVCGISSLFMLHLFVKFSSNLFNSFFLSYGWNIIYMISHFDPIVALNLIVRSSLLRATHLLIMLCLFYQICFKSFFYLWQRDFRR